jgi:8-oxo-dGTP diphosphatase
MSRPGTDARDAAWFPVTGLPELAFDHDVILNVALERLRGKVRYQPIGFELLPSRFTLRQLQHLYEVILGRELDKRNFRKKVLAMGMVKETSEIEKNVAHRAARLYRFDKRTYDRLTRKGVDFEL